MGAWGAGLYEDDTAADLRDAVRLVAKVPGTGERLLSILLEMQPGLTEDHEDWTTFWLVVADQFERRGIACPEALARALSIIESRSDLERLAALEMSERDLKKREAMLAELAARLRSQQPPRPRTFPRKPPPHHLAPGEVYRFPVMGVSSVNAWFASWEEAKFNPDGWGALVVLECGRAFDWIPWCAIASLTVDRNHPPSFDDAMRARLILHLQTDGAAKCVPRKSHIQRIGMERLGRVPLNEKLARILVSKWKDTEAIECGWSISSAAFGNGIVGPPLGPAIVDIVAHGAS